MTAKATPRPSPPRAPRGGLDAAGLSPSGITRYRGGLFIPKALLEREKKAAAAAYPRLEAEFGEELQYHRKVLETIKLVPDGARSPLSPSQVEWRMKRAIRRDYARAFLLGKRASGDLTSMTDDQSSRLASIRRDEYTYLRKFIRDIGDGGGKIPYEQRMAYYQNALKEAFWVGYVLGDQSAGRLVFWKKGPTESCQDCLEQSERKGGIPIEEFVETLIPRGIVPQSGNLECHGLQCQCYLTDETGARIIPR